MTVGRLRRVAMTAVHLILIATQIPRSLKNLKDGLIAGLEHPSKLSRVPIHQRRPKQNILIFKTKIKHLGFVNIHDVCSGENIRASSAESQFIDGDLNKQMLILKTNIKNQRGFR